jgi:hypothetical protein
MALASLVALTSMRYAEARLQLRFLFRCALALPLTIQSAGLSRPALFEAGSRFATTS